MNENKEKNINFEDSMKRLEKITEELGKDGVKIEDARSLYEEGVGLVRECNNILETTERKIKMLQVSANGEITEIDFSADRS